MSLQKCESNWGPKVKAKSLYGTTVPNENILLFQGRIELHQNDNIYAFENARIEAMWPPTQYCFIKLPETQLPIVDGKQCLLDIPLRKVSGIPVEVFRAINEKGYRVIFKAKQNFFVNGSKEFDLILASVPNFFDMKLQLKTSNWDIRLEPANNIKDLVRVMSLQSGFALTHVAYIEQLNKERFDFDQASKILRSLETYISFMRGAWCGLFLPVGWLNDDISWYKWDLPMVMPWRTTPVYWCNTFDIVELSKAFDKFMSLPEHLELINVISFYTGANGYEAPDISVIMTQLALELLVALYAPEGPYKEDKDIKIRRLLTKKRISTEIPFELEQLKKYCEQNIKDGTQIDGPKAIVYLRNSFMHPKRDNIKKIVQVPVSVMVEATSLGLAYIELILLESLGYNGQYTDRFTKRSQKVQWSESKDAIQPVVSRAMP
jgi:hypothetical protein